jgi:hypothetical protein
VTENRTLERLRGYLATLKDIDQRWVKDRNGYHAASGDLERANQAALELIDLFNDRVATTQYARMLHQAYADGCKNPTGNPSLACIKAFETVVTAAITRITENPAILEVQNTVEAAPRSPNGDQPKAAVENFPDKITLKWLYEKMPVDLWWQLGAFVGSAFLLGLTLGSACPWLMSWLFNLFGHSRSG